MVSLWRKRRQAKTIDNIMVAYILVRVARNATGQLKVEEFHRTQYTPIVSSTKHDRNAGAPIGADDVNAVGFHDGCPDNGLCCLHGSVRG
ncbi:hypothetical protein LSAT2_002838 [Lamellibrachia satsuma]|nr:hypothetical protein LSAT2_002838 [Lamellibrachia satsuma]